MNGTTAMYTHEGRPTSRNSMVKSHSIIFYRAGLVLSRLLTCFLFGIENSFLKVLKLKLL
jgi:hypothetical protein